MASFKKTGIVKPKPVSAGPGASFIPAPGMTARPYGGGALATFPKGSLPGSGISLAQMQAQKPLPPPPPGTHERFMYDLSMAHGLAAQQGSNPGPIGGKSQPAQPGGPYTPRPDLGPNVGFGAGLPQPQLEAQPYVSGPIAPTQTTQFISPELLTQADLIRLHNQGLSQQKFDQRGRPKPVPAGGGASFIPAPGMTARPYGGGALATFPKGSLPKSGISLAQMQAQKPLPPPPPGTHERFMYDLSMAHGLAAQFSK